MPTKGPASTRARGRGGVPGAGIARAPLGCGDGNAFAVWLVGTAGYRVQAGASACGACRAREPHTHTPMRVACKCGLHGRLRPGSALQAPARAARSACMMGDMKERQPRSPAVTRTACACMRVWALYSPLCKRGGTGRRRAAPASPGDITRAASQQHLGFERRQRDRERLRRCQHAWVVVQDVGVCVHLAKLHHDAAGAHARQRRRRR